MSRAATGAFGERLALKEQELKERNASIRERAAGGETQKALAKEFGISLVRVQQILSLAPREAAPLRSKAERWDAAVAAGAISEDWTPGSNGDGAGGNGSEP